MELRLLRYFVAVAEELHLARAAERLGVEQSPVSRAMRDLEGLLGVRLFDRSRRRTRLTWAGKVFLDESRRVLTLVNQASHAARAAARGCRDTLRVAVSDGLGQPRVATLLADSREEEPELDLRLCEMPLAEQARALLVGSLDVGFALADKAGSGIATAPVWQDRLCLLLPARHPLLGLAEVPIAQVLKFPLVLYHPDSESEGHPALNLLLQASESRPRIADTVTTPGAMLTLIAAGYGIGFTSHTIATGLHRPDLIQRSLAGPPILLTTYLLRLEGMMSEPVRRLVERVRGGMDEQR